MENKNLFWILLSKYTLWLKVPKPVEGEVPENRRLTRTRQKAQEIESKKEESSEPMEEDHRPTRTTRKNQEDEADVAPPQRATRTLQTAKVL